jgi:hypothetical protein
MQHEMRKQIDGARLEGDAKAAVFQLRARDVEFEVVEAVVSVGNSLHRPYSLAFRFRSRISPGAV